MWGPQNWRSSWQESSLAEPNWLNPNPGFLEPRTFGSKHLCIRESEWSVSSRPISCEQEPRIKSETNGSVWTVSGKDYRIEKKYVGKRMIFKSLWKERRNGCEMEEWRDWLIDGCWLETRVRLLPFISAFLDPLFPWLRPSLGNSFMCRYPL